MLSDRLILAGTAVLLLLPLAFNVPELRGTVELMSPRVSSGDEPHYLVSLNSVIRDGDLDLANNYRSVHEGSAQAGDRFRRVPLVHHSVWYVGDRRVEWATLFETEGERWSRDAQGLYLPTPRRGARPDFLPGPEYPRHPSGLPLLLAPIVVFFRTTKHVEAVALVCSALVTVAALVLLRSLALRLTDDTSRATRVAALTLLGTPLWHYGRSLFTEPYLAFCAVGAYALALRQARPLAAGALIGIGMLMKPPFGVLLLPLLGDAALERRLGSALRLALPPLAATGIVLAMNAWTLGSPWRPPMPFETGSLREGATGLWLDAQNGIFAVAPLAIAALAGWPQLLRQQAARAWAPLCGFALYFLVMALWIDWGGGYCYGPRLIVPVLPLFCLGLVGFLASPWWRWSMTRRAALALFALSLWINGWAALHHLGAFEGHPIVEMLRDFGWLAS